MLGLTSVFILLTSVNTVFSAFRVKRNVNEEARVDSDVFTFSGINESLESVKENTSVDPIESYTTYEYNNGKESKTVLARRSLPNTGMDKIYKELKSVMFYKPSENEIMQGIKTTRSFHTDAEDIRSTSRNGFDIYPASIYTPKVAVQELQRSESVIHKVNDKRHVVHSNENIKPVYEHVEEDGPQHYPAVPLTRGYAPEAPVTPEYRQDNYEPYYSYGFNDYAEKEIEEDPVSFKGAGYNYEDYYDGHDTNQRNRRLGGTYYPAETVYPTHGHDYGAQKFASGDAVTEKGFVRDLAFDKNEKSSNNDEQHKKSYEDGANNYRGIRDYIDKFHNRYGAEDNKKNANFELKTISDKMDKRKGFRRVYHKDEYQEDNEFFDNTGHTAKSHEKGSTDMRNGGQEGLLQSHSAAALGEEKKAHHNAGASNQNSSGNSQSGHDNSKGYDREFHRHHDAAQNSASSHGSHI